LLAGFHLIFLWNQSAWALQQNRFALTLAAYTGKIFKL
jgi:hypothetical protein